MKSKWLATGLALLGLALGACSKTKDVRSADVTPPAYTVTPVESGAKMSFNLPQSVKGGVIALTLDNTGKLAHDFQLVEQTPGHPLSELVKSIANDQAVLPTWLVAAGGLGTTESGHSSNVTFDVAPGKYFYFCTENGDEGSHAAKGMAGEITFEGTSGATLPSATGSITASEYTFAITGLKAGSNTIAFSNAGKQLHHFVGVPLLPGKTLADAKRSLANENSNEQPPVDFSNPAVAAVISPGHKLVTTIDVKAASNYVFVCFMPDRGTAGPPHAAKGMIVEQKIA